ncbi:hypothetical protein MSSD14B_41980 [Marinobacter salsuginis]|uniref:Uncharacterized protein n=1 Tax=Marinobacter salsuginis TaxID=418719 RepID=A0A5M3Q6X6_9GAMM|nr:hypothetical protein MSSD14B_41980 [Marinobacter salsuginis]
MACGLAPAISFRNAVLYPLGNFCFNPSNGIAMAGQLYGLWEFTRRLQFIERGAAESSAAKSF